MNMSLVIVSKKERERERERERLCPPRLPPTIVLAYLCIKRHTAHDGESRRLIYLFIAERDIIIISNSV